MPEGISSFVRIKLKNLELAVPLQRSCHIPQHTIHLQEHRQDENSTHCNNQYDLATFEIRTSEEEENECFPQC